MVGGLIKLIMEVIIPIDQKLINEIVNRVHAAVQMSVYYAQFSTRANFAFCISLSAFRFPTPEFRNQIPLQSVVCHPSSAIRPLSPIFYAFCPMPFAPCPMPYALCPMPFAPCPMPYALSSRNPQHATHNPPIYHTNSDYTPATVPA